MKLHRLSYTLTILFFLSMPAFCQCDKFLANFDAVYELPQEPDIDNLNNQKKFAIDTLGKNIVIAKVEHNYNGHYSIFTLYQITKDLKKAEKKVSVKINGINLYDLSMHSGQLIVKGVYSFDDRNWDRDTVSSWGNYSLDILPFERNFIASININTAEPNWLVFLKSKSKFSGTNITVAVANNCLGLIYYQGPDHEDSLELSLGNKSILVSKGKAAFFLLENKTGTLIGGENLSIGKKEEIDDFFIDVDTNIYLSTKFQFRIAEFSNYGRGYKNFHSINIRKYIASDEIKLLSNDSLIVDFAIYGGRFLYNGNQILVYFDYGNEIYQNGLKDTIIWEEDDNDRIAFFHYNKKGLTYINNYKEWGYKQIIDINKDKVVITAKTGGEQHKFGFYNIDLKKMKNYEKSLSIPDSCEILELLAAKSTGKYGYALISARKWRAAMEDAYPTEEQRNEQKIVPKSVEKSEDDSPYTLRTYIVRMKY